MTQTSGRMLSGITPSGDLTLGNYLGALRQFAATPSGVEAFYCVADLHALTMPHDPRALRRRTRDVAALFIAAGVDPERATVFVQSDVREHLELSYLLECTAYVGELNRMIQFKEKGGRPQTRASLFTYPCLMAADILLYGATEVPVGDDQRQHVELTREIAARFNRTYGEVFVVPRAVVPPAGARVADLQDPTRKMSKSAPEQAAGVIRMTDAADVVAAKVRRAVTDSDAMVAYDPERKPGVSNLLDILSACTGREPQDLSADFTQYGRLKQAVADAVVAVLEPLQARYRELVAGGPGDELDLHLVAGAAHARTAAEPVVRQVRAAMGVASAGRC